MVFVKAKPGQSADSLIRQFTKKIVESGIIQDIKDRQFYKPPSVVRKEKRKKRR